MISKSNQPTSSPEAQETTVVPQPGASGQQGKTPVSHAGSAGSVTREAHQLTPFEVARFWTRVKGGEHYQCWEWQGAKRGLYGRAHGRGVHRLAYELIKGPIPDGLIIRHRCDNPLCCNPAHLLVGTASDNAQDALERGQFATGERHGNAKLTAGAIAYIRQNAHRESLGRLAERFGVARSTVSYVINGRTWNPRETP